MKKIIILCIILILIALGYTIYLSLIGGGIWG